MSRHTVFAMRAHRLTAVLSAALVLLVAACGAPVKIERPAPLTPAEVEAYARMTLIKGAPSGEKQMINFFYSVNPACRATGIPKITVVSQPTHGTIIVEQGEDYPNFPKDNVRYACNTSIVPVERLYYQSAPGYVGKDSAVVEVLFPYGDFRHQTYVITVQ